MKTVVLGMDALEWDYLEKFIDEGLLPNFEELIEEENSADLRSTEPPITVPAWMSMFTGKSADELDVYRMNNLPRDSYEGDLALSHEFSGEVWDEVDQEAIVIGVPGSFPAKDSDATVLTGALTPDTDSKGFCNDEAFRQKYSEELDEYKIDIDIEHIPGKEQRTYDEIKSILDARHNLFKSVLKNEDPELFVGVYMAPDRLQHHLLDEDLEWPRKLYQEMDEKLGEIRQLLDEDTNLVIVSDHGFTRCEYSFSTNHWLNKKGYLKYKGEESTVSRSRVKRILEKTGLVNFLKYLPSGAVEEASEKLPSGREIDWENTKAFSKGAYGMIYINTEERPEGIVPEENFEEVREDIISDLESEDEKGNIVAQKYEDLYSRDLNERAADIMFHFESREIDASASDEGRVYEPKQMYGWHDEEGVFISTKSKLGGRLDITEVKKVIQKSLEL